MSPWPVIVGGFIGLYGAQRGWSFGRTVLISLVVGAVWELAV